MGAENRGHVRFALSRIGFHVMSTRAPSVFASPGFRAYFAGQAFSYVGDGLRVIAIPLLVFHLTGSALSVGVTFALELGPFALFGLVGGSLADRLDRRSLMLACDFIRFAILTFFAIAFALKFLTIAMLYVGIVAISIAAAVFMGGQAASIPYLLGKERSTRGTATLMAAEQVAQTVLPPVGGAFFALVGPLPALVVNALTYLVSQMSLALAPTFGPREAPGLPAVSDIARDVRAGLRSVWNDAALRATTFGSLALNFFGLMTGAILIPFLKRDFGASDLDVGFALGVASLGAVAGSFVAGRIPRTWPFGRTLLIAYALDGFFFLPIVFTHDLRIAILTVAITNGCVLFEIAQIIGWRMRITPEEAVGRVFGAARFVAMAGTVPGAILAGYLADRYDARLPIAISAAGYFATALVLWFARALREDAR